MGSSVLPSEALFALAMVGPALKIGGVAGCSEAAVDSMTVAT